MKKVLIAIDYNPSAQKVAESGYEYARAMNAEILIIHAIPEITYYDAEYLPIMGFSGFSTDGAFMNIDEQKNEAALFLECVVHHLGNNNIKTHVLDGTTSETILGYAVQWKADLIVIGTQSHVGFERLSPGNVTSLILKHSNIPVLVIPAEKDEMSITRNSQYANLRV